MTNLAITAAHNYTAVGHGSVMTASSVRAGLSRLFINDDYVDREGNPVTMATIKGIDNSPDVIRRIIKAACLSMAALLESYFLNNKEYLPPIHLLLGAAPGGRPGPRFEDACIHDLVKIIEKQAPCRSTQVFSQGSASFMYALEQAQGLITTTPEAICIIGCIDSLLSTSTLDWFEKDRRLKSETYGRHHGLVPGEAVGFLIVEDADHALRNTRRIQARIVGTGVSIEPSPRTSGPSITASGLSDACRKALNGAVVKTVLGDLNGENSRAREWGLAETRCLSPESRELLRPADHYGDIGVASGVILTAIAAQGLNHNWMRAPVLIFCSDDHGACGSLVLRRGDLDDEALNLYGYKEENNG